MFGDVGTQLLKLMGQSGVAPGAITGTDVGRALAQLKAAVGAMPKVPAAPAAATRDPEAEPPVALSRRALPLIDLLDRATQAGDDVVWEKS